MNSVMTSNLIKLVRKGLKEVIRIERSPQRESVSRNIYKTFI